MGMGLSQEMMRGRERVMGTEDRKQISEGNSGCISEEKLHLEAKVVCLENFRSKGHNTFPI